MQLTCLEQDKEIEKLEKTLDKLEAVRQRQAKRIASMKTDIDTREKVTDEHRQVSENTVQSLSSELRTTKQALSEASLREKEVRRESCHRGRFGFFVIAHSFKNHTKM